MDLINEEKSLMTKYMLLTQKFRLEFCIDCLGTQKQKDRNCSLFRGLNKPTCQEMTDSIDNKIKPYNKKLMKKILSTMGVRNR